MQDPITTTVTLTDGTKLTLTLHSNNTVRVTSCDQPPRLAYWTGEKITGLDATIVGHTELARIDEALAELDRRGR